MGWIRHEKCHRDNYETSRLWNDGDYWVIDLSGRSIEVCRKPRDGRYIERTVFGGGEIIRPLAASRTELAVTIFYPQPEPGYQRYGFSRLGGVPIAKPAAGDGPVVCRFAFCGIK